MREMASKGPPKLPTFLPRRELIRKLRKGKNKISKYI